MAAARASMKIVANEDLARYQSDHPNRTANPCSSRNGTQSRSASRSCRTHALPGAPEPVRVLDFCLHLDPPSLLDEWERLIVAYDCKGKVAHDARIVAA